KRDDGHSAFEKSARARRCGPLRPSEVRASGSAYIAVTPGLRAHPFLRIEAVGNVVTKRVPVTFGLPSSATILDHHCIARTCVALRVGEVLVRLSIGAAHQDYGMAALALRTKHICGQFRSVSHWDHHVLFENEFRLLG